MWKILNGLLLSKGSEHFKKWKCSLTKANRWKTSSLTRRVMVENCGCLDVFLHYLDLVTIESSWRAHQLTSVNHYLKSRARVATFLFLVENIITDSGGLVFMSCTFSWGIVDAQNDRERDFSIQQRERVWWLVAPTDKSRFHSSMPFTTAPYFRM